MSHGVIEIDSDNEQIEDAHPIFPLTTIIAKLLYAKVFPHERFV